MHDPHPTHPDALADADDEAAAALPSTERVEIADEVVDGPAPGAGRTFRAPPAPRWRGPWRLVQFLATVGLLAWLVAPGGFHGGWFWWAVLGVVLLPVVGFLSFVGLIVLAFVRAARRGRRG